MLRGHPRAAVLHARARNNLVKDEVWQSGRCCWLIWLGMGMSGGSGAAVRAHSDEAEGGSCSCLLRGPDRGPCPSANDGQQVVYEYSPSPTKQSWTKQRTMRGGQRKMQTVQTAETLSIVSQCSGAGDMARMARHGSGRHGRVAAGMAAVGSV